MSTAQNLQQHPAYIQAKTRGQAYYNRLDKEVCFSLVFRLVLRSTLHFALIATTTSFPTQLTKYPVLNNFEQRTQVPKTYAVLGGAFVLVILHFFNSLAKPISNLIGWGLPAYLSFKAIETPSPQDDIQWLTYWVVFGFFNFVESFAARLVLYYVPWYFAFKTLFVIWLQLPVFRVRVPFLLLCPSRPCPYLFFSSLGVVCTRNSMLTLL